VTIRFGVFKHKAAGIKDLLFECPGCGIAHAFRVSGPGPVWEWNGDLDRGTFSPSLLCRWDENVCHAFVRAGRIQFLNDCTHPLAGQTHDIPEWEGIP